MDPLTLALAIGGGSAALDLIGGLFASDAAGDAARIQSQSVDRALNVLSQQYGEARGGLLPFLESGRVNLEELNRAMRGGEFTPQVDLSQDPGVAYRMERANEALQKSAAARGRLLSGGTIRSIAELNQALASQEFGAAYGRAEREAGSRFQRLFSLSEQGRGTGNVLAGLAQQQGASTADLLTAQGNVRAAGRVAQGNALQSALSGAGGDVLNTALLFGMGGFGGGGGGGSLSALGPESEAYRNILAVRT